LVSIEVSEDDGGTEHQVVKYLHKGVGTNVSMKDDGVRFDVPKRVENGEQSSVKASSGAFPLCRKHEAVEAIAGVRKRLLLTS